MAKKQHIAMMPCPGMGHLIPLVEVARKLRYFHDFSVTFIIPTVAPVPKSLTTHLQALPQGMDYILLPPIEFHDPSELEKENGLMLIILRSLPAFRDAMKSLNEKTPLSALVVDLFNADAIDIATEFNIPSFVYFPSTAVFLSLLFYLPKLDKTVSSKFKDMSEPTINIPGFRYSVRGSELPEVVTEQQKKVSYKQFLGYAEVYRTAKGIMINSFVDLEPEAIKFLQDKSENGLIPPIYPVGPIFQTDSVGGVDDFKCMKWLNDQPSGSVLLVSFGSGGTLSRAQFTELAFGLELSGHKFIWGVKSPNDESARAALLTTESDDPLGHLPPGFQDRTKGRGFVVPSWVPQIDILKHSSTGGFLTHCGWNSVLEGVVYGVPLIAWPLYAEQKLNAVIVTEDMRVALRPKADDNGVVGRDEVAKVVKCLMASEEGVKIRDRAKMLKDLAAMTLSEEGSSTKAMSELVLKLRN